MLNSIFKFQVTLSETLSIRNVVSSFPSSDSDHVKLCSHCTRRSLSLSLSGKRKKEENDLVKSVSLIIIIAVAVASLRSKSPNFVSPKNQKSVFVRPLCRVVINTRNSKSVICVAVVVEKPTYASSAACFVEKAFSLLESFAVVEVHVECLGE